MDWFGTLGTNRLNTALVQILFVFCTFMSMIVFLNMLVAIMGDTFDTVYEKKQLHGMKTKLNFVSEIEKDYFKKDESDQYDFLYVIKPYHHARDASENAQKELNLDMQKRLIGIDEKM